MGTPLRANIATTNILSVIFMRHLSNYLLWRISLLFQRKDSIPHTPSALSTPLFSSLFGRFDGQNLRSSALEMYWFVFPNDLQRVFCLYFETNHTISSYNPSYYFRSELLTIRHINGGPVDSRTFSSLSRVSWMYPGYKSKIMLLIVSCLLIKLWRRRWNSDDATSDVTDPPTSDPMLLIPSSSKH